MLSTVIAVSSVPTEAVNELNNANASVSIFSAIARPACAPRSAITSRCAESRNISVTWKYVPISPRVISTEVVLVSSDATGAVPSVRAFAVTALYTGTCNTLPAFAGKVKGVTNWRAIEFSYAAN